MVQRFAVLVLSAAWIRKSVNNGFDPTRCASRSAQAQEVGCIGSPTLTYLILGTCHLRRHVLALMIMYRRR